MAISSALAGVMAKLVFTYEWSWFVALMFGSIISATDPVAVVSLLNELGMLHVYTVLELVAVLTYELYHIFPQVLQNNFQRSSKENLY